jgi:hypothetical protein
MLWACAQLCLSFSFLIAQGRGLVTRAPLRTEGVLVAWLLKRLYCSLEWIR